MYPFASGLEFARSRMQDRLARAEIARLARRPRADEAERAPVLELTPHERDTQPIAEAVAYCDREAS